MKQHSLPVRIKEGHVDSLTKVSLTSNGYNEQWIQDICFNKPEVLPITEIEQTFNDMVPICKELSSPSGGMN